MELGERNSRYGLWSWDYKKTKSKATLGLVQILYIHKGPSHRKIESQEAEAMHQQAEHGLTDAW